MRDESSRFFSHASLSDFVDSNLARCKQAASTSLFCRPSHWGVVPPFSDQDRRKPIPIPTGYVISIHCSSLRSSFLAPLRERFSPFSPAYSFSRNPSPDFFSASSSIHITQPHPPVNFFFFFFWLPYFWKFAAPRLGWVSVSRQVAGGLRSSPLHRCASGPGGSEFYWRHVQGSHAKTLISIVALCFPCLDSFFRSVFVAIYVQPWGVGGWMSPWGGERGEGKERSLNLVPQRTYGKALGLWGLKLRYVGGGRERRKIGRCDC